MRRTPPAAFLLLILLLAACGGERRRPDIVLVTIDTLRADRVGAWGHRAARTPVMDRLAREGVRFANCQSPVPITLPSHASMFTGRNPPGHGVRNNASYRLPDSTPTLATELAAGGYRTGAFVAAFPLAPRFGLDRGFEAYDATLPDAGASAFTYRERPASEVVRSALAWLDRTDDARPIFLWVHFFEPHAPYEPGADWAGDPYDGEVAAADRAVGTLVEGFTARRGAPPVTVVTSDHGEGLGEHGEASHAIFLYQTTLHVPLVVHGAPGWPQGRVVEQAVSLTDLAPTLLSVAGLDPAPLRIDGIALDPERPVPDRPLYAESVYGMEAYRWAPLFAQRTGERKVIRSRRSLAFDLGEDPRELDDLLEARPDWATDDLRALDARIAADTLRRPGATRQPSAAEREALAALGYAGGAGESAPGLMRAIAELPDATDRHQEFAALHRAETFLGQDDPAGAAASLDAVLRDNPDNVWAWMLMERARTAQGRTAEAIDAAGRAITLRPDWLELHRDLARLHAGAGEPDAALAAWREVLRLDPAATAYRLEAVAQLQRAGRNSEALQLLRETPDAADDAEVQGALARICFSLDRVDEGRAHLGRARELADDPELHRLSALYARRAGDWSGVLTALDFEPREPADEELRGEALQRLGRTQEAVEAYQRALAADDELALAHNNLAWALATALDRPAEALHHASRAVELRPDEPEFHDTLVEVLLRLGREDEARARLSEARALHPDDPGLRRRQEAREPR